MNDPQVLIVGAGPTGLALALFLAHSGVRSRIIEKNSGPGQTSRAMVVQARTLEFYRQVGIAEDVVSSGIKMGAAHVWKDSHEIAEIKFGDMGHGLSPYPFVLSYPQDDHERFLGSRLKASGIEVEWGTELVSFAETTDGIHATLRRDGTEENCSASYICGCDGAHSIVRQTLGLKFPGGTYDQRFFVADVDTDGAAAVKDGFSMCLGAHELCLIFPIRSTGMHRLIGLVPVDLNDRDNITFEDIQPYVEKIVGIHVGRVNWFSTYRVHHRVSDRFRSGRAFILGDAGHVHSPAGGQGMNTGIGDAVNLAWKLAAVLQSHTDLSILDTYEEERIAFAKSLVATTDRVFKLVVGTGAAGEVIRETLVPHLAPFLLGFSGVREAAFRFVSQTRISYRDSTLSEGSSGDIQGGDRLPWVQLGDSHDNYEPLKSLAWQIHIYGTAANPLRDAAQNIQLALHEFDWTDHIGHAGLKRDALYLIRPDGYVGLAHATQDSEKLQAYISMLKIIQRDVAS